MDNFLASSTVESIREQGRLQAGLVGPVRRMVWLGMVGEGWLEDTYGWVDGDVYRRLGGW